MKFFILSSPLMSIVVDDAALRIRTNAEPLVQQDARPIESHDRDPRRQAQDGTRQYPREERPSPADGARNAPRPEARAHGRAAEDGARDGPADGVIGYRAQHRRIEGGDRPPVRGRCDAITVVVVFVFVGRRLRRRRRSSFLLTATPPGQNRPCPRTPCTPPPTRWVAPGPNTGGAKRRGGGCADDRLLSLQAPLAGAGDDRGDGGTGLRAAILRFRGRVGGSGGEAGAGRRDDR